MVYSFLYVGLFQRLKSRKAKVRFCRIRKFHYFDFHVKKLEQFLTRHKWPEQKPFRHLGLSHQLQPQTRLTVSEYCFTQILNSSFGKFFPHNLQLILGPFENFLKSSLPPPGWWLVSVVGCFYLDNNSGDDEHQSCIQILPHKNFGHE